jgi:hypothetical protein
MPNSGVGVVGNFQRRQLFNQAPCLPQALMDKPQEFFALVLSPTRYDMRSWASYGMCVLWLGCHACAIALCWRSRLRLFRQLTVFCTLRSFRPFAENWRFKLQSRSGGLLGLRSNCAPNPARCVPQQCCGSLGQLHQSH